jgi:hypothetical protein
MSPLFSNIISANKLEAKQFLIALGCNNNTRFRTFDDAKNGSVIPQCYPADQFDKLPDANRKGAGVFVVVNETTGDSDKDVSKVRAVFVDLDGAPLEPVMNCGLKPHITVESSPGRFHAYWKVADCPLDRFKPIQQAIAARFNGDKSIINLSRVMRLPGFIHQKKEPFLSRIMNISEHEPYSVQQIIDGLALEIGAKQQAHGHGTTSNNPFQGSSEGGRTKSIERSAGVLFYKGYSIDDAVAFCETLDATQNKPPLAETHPGKVRETVEGIHRRYYGVNAWPEPLKLPEGLPPVKTLEPAMIPEPLRGWLMDIADRMQIPPDFSTAAAVVALGIIIGRGCGIHPKRHDDWLVIPNLWGAVIGRPSLMKTPAITEAQRHLVRLETEARTEYQGALQQQEINQEVDKIKRAAICEEIKRAVKKKNDAEIEQARARLADLDNEAPATRRRYQTQDGTTEKIGELLNQNPRGLLVNRDELIGWFRSLDKSGREGDRAFYLEAWNGTRGYTYDRIGRGTLDIEALCVSIFGAITPGPLSDYVYQASRGGNGDDGLLQRFQIMVWPDVPKDWKNVDRFPDTIEKNRACKIFRALTGVIPGAVKVDGVDLPALRFTPAGQEIFDTWRHDLETRLRSDHGLPPSLESHLAKYRSLMPSLALIFHVVELADGSTEAGPVSDRAALRAAAWCHYLESHAGRVYGGATMPGMESAREIVKHIKRGAIKDGATFRDVYRNQWTRLATLEEVRAGMEVLQEYDWLTLDEITTGGRPSKIVRLNPAIKV